MSLEKTHNRSFTKQELKSESYNMISNEENLTLANKTINNKSGISAEKYEEVKVEKNSKDSILEYIISWYIIVLTVYYIAASFHCLLQWLPYNEKWDLAGFIYCAIFAWLSFSFGISSKSKLSIYNKGLVTLAIFIIWAFTFPLLLYSFGYVD